MFAICVCAFGVFSRYILDHEGARRGGISTFLLSVGTFCQQGAYGQVKMISSHTIICCMLFSSLLFYNFYTSILVSMLIEAKHETSINTIDDLIESNFLVRFLDSRAVGNHLRVNLQTMWFSEI